jgi:sn-glycerol 3-phosphate transport system permease protein
MVTARRGAWIPHAVLIARLLVVLFPIYVALVAASHALPDILKAPMTPVPGPRLAANFAEALTAGTAKTSGEPVTAMLLNSLVMATTLLAIVPPVMVVLLMQRWFVRGLVEAEK